ncbi:MAG: helix-turn-helix domain-containing protein [Sulfurimonas sp.]|uniref:helix-turn-helix domain-containing protein n=1 Tax=Sulfurimonas sp. TaxID=2022749 RepID=UPI00262C9D8C|nr:helix-turn-helix transcriptional regulator [Sulfurimonas sp.]MCW8895864.1 helix-turn-helix domain-containing protein [Sulfurimonas sp.]MCW8954957.1 helix-turn-helix domain-containing protein [Sulfurimonas sp.]
MRSIEELPLETMNNFHKQIGLNVKKYRNKKGYTQLQLSQALGHKSVGLVSQAELYLKKQHFNLEHLYKIAFILECDISDLIPQTLQNKS